MKATASTSKSWMKRLRVIVAGAMLATVTAVGFGTSASPAEAWPWNPTVTLQGRSVCASSASTWVYVIGSNGEQGWATNGSGNYRFTFRRVPSSGMTVRVNYGTRTFRCTDTFGLQRPAIGTTATRNVIRIIPNG